MLQVKFPFGDTSHPQKNKLGVKIKSTRQHNLHVYCRAQCGGDNGQGTTFRKKPLGQLAPKLSYLVTSKSISISEKHGKLVATEKYLVALSSSDGSRPSVEVQAH